MINWCLFSLVQDKTELVHLQENLFQSRKEGLHENAATVVTQAEVWGNANERDLSQALQYKYDALKDRLLRDALVRQVGVTEWAALSEKDRFTKLAQMKLKVQALQREGSSYLCDVVVIGCIIYIIHVSFHVPLSIIFFHTSRKMNHSLEQRRSGILRPEISMES